MGGKLSRFSFHCPVDSPSELFDDSSVEWHSFISSTDEQWLITVLKVWHGNLRHGRCLVLLDRFLVPLTGFFHKFFLSFRSTKSFIIFVFACSGLFAFFSFSFSLYIPQLKKAMELKLTEIALSRFKNHTGERTTDKGVQVGRFLLKIRWYF